MRDYTPPPVNAREILSSPVHFIAFGFGTGLSPRAPGTVGSLAALPFWWLMSHLTAIPYLVCCALLFVFGCWVCGASAKKLGVHDHGGIVFDEIVGMLVTLAPLVIMGDLGPDPLAPGKELVAEFPLLLMVGFLLFRFFDIVKPWPIRWLDAKVKGGFGIMVDDLLAAFMAALLLFVIIVFLPSAPVGYFLDKPL